MKRKKRFLIKQKNKLAPKLLPSSQLAQERANSGIPNFFFNMLLAARVPPATMVPTAGQVRHAVRGWEMNHSVCFARELSE